MKKPPLISLLIFLCTGILSAEVLHLNDGSRINGDIAGREGDVFIVETPDGILKIKEERIESISIDSRERIPVNESRSKSKINLSNLYPYSNDSLNIFLGYKFSNNEAEADIYFDGNYLFKLGNHVSIGPGVGYSEYDNKVRTFSKGTITSTPILAKVRIYHPSKRKINVFLDIAPGYFVLDHHVDRDLSRAFSLLGFTIEEEIENAFGLQYGGGISFSPSESAKIGISGYYQMLKPDVEVTLRNNISGTSFTVTDDINLNSFILGGHVTIYFP